MITLRTLGFRGPSIMIRLTPGDPTTLHEVPLSSLKRKVKA